METAELRAKQQKVTTMDFWRAGADQLITSNGFKLLEGTGKISHEFMKAQTADTYKAFDRQRKEHEAHEADALDDAEIKALEEQLKQRKKS